MHVVVVLFIIVGIGYIVTIYQSVPIWIRQLMENNSEYNKMKVRNYSRSNSSTRWFTFKILLLLTLSLVIFDVFCGFEISQENVACQSDLREAKLSSLKDETGQNHGGLVNDGSFAAEISPPESSLYTITRKYTGVDVIVHQIQLIHNIKRGENTTNVSTTTKSALSNNSKYGRPLFDKSYSIIYNSVPNTDSRSLETGIRSVFYIMNLTKKCLNIPPYLENSHNESALTSWLTKYVAPAFIHGQVKFAPLPKNSDIVYINILREPIERLISHFYFDYYGDVELPKNSTNFVDIKKCIQTPGIKCHDRYQYFKSVTLGAICGYDKRCTTPSNFTLDRAKRNLEEYTIIGITEDMEGTLQILEMLVPGMLAGLSRKYKTMKEGMMEKYNTTKTLDPDLELMSILRQELAYEYEFYYYVKDRFEDVKRRFL